MLPLRHRFIKPVYSFLVLLIDLKAIEILTDDDSYCSQSSMDCKNTKRKPKTSVLNMWVVTPLGVE